MPYYLSDDGYVEVFIGRRRRRRRRRCKITFMILSSHLIDVNRFQFYDGNTCKYDEIRDLVFDRLKEKRPPRGLAILNTGPWN